MQQVNTVSRLSDKHDYDLLAALLRAERALEENDVSGAERDVAAALARDRRSPEAHYLLGEIARRRGDLTAADKSLRRALQLDERVGSFHHALGNLLQDQGRLDEAILCYRRALRKAPTLAAAWNDLGTAHFASGQPERAADCYRNAVRLAPANIVAASNLGSTLRALGDVRGALRAYRHELWLRLRSAIVRPRPSQGLSMTAPQIVLGARGWLRRGNLRFAEALSDWALAANAAHVPAIALKAGLLERSGRAAAALELLETAPRDLAHDAQLAATRGRLYMALRRYDHAAQALREALAAGSRDKSVELDLALCIAAAGQPGEATEMLERYARAQGDGKAWTTLGRLRLDLDQKELAFEALEQAFKSDPFSAPALAQLARLRVMQEKVADAVSLGRSAVQRDPACADAQFWLGRALALAWLWEEACDAFREAVELDAGWISVNAAIWLSNGYRTLEKPEEAETVLRRAIERYPQEPEVVVHLAIAIIDRGELARAKSELSHVLTQHPQHVLGLTTMCAVKSGEGEMEEALRYARMALEQDPRNVIAHHNYGLTLLKLGLYREGWEEYEWRKRLETRAGSYLRFPLPNWQGDTLAGKTIFLFAEQGLGDEIMFASCVPEIVAQAGQVVIECDPRLAPLFRRSFARAAVFGRPPTPSNAWMRSLDPQPVVQAAIGSLPRFLRRQIEDFPMRRGYLQADPVRVAAWRERLSALGPGRKLGISWRGGLARTARVRRSLELAELQPLLRLPNAHFISLQYGKVADEVAAFERRHRITLPHWQDVLDDYDETAALVCALDGVVSVCTAIVHLTGSLGRPVLVLAPFSPEWRYGISGEAMPWYPSVKVLRQPSPGEWGPVLQTALQKVNTGWGG